MLIINSVISGNSGIKLLGLRIGGGRDKKIIDSKRMKKFWLTFVACKHGKLTKDGKDGKILALVSIVARWPAEHFRLRRSMLWTATWTQEP